MSYILDALKKLEQKKHQQGGVPDLLAEHSTTPQTHSAKKVLPYILLIVLLLNAAILLAWFRPWDSGQDSSSAKNIIAEENETPEIKEVIKAPVRESKVNQKPLNQGKSTMPMNAVKNIPSVDTEKPVSTDIAIKREIKSENNTAESVEEPDDNPDFSNEQLTSLKIVPSREELKTLKEEMIRERMPAREDETVNASADIEDSGQNEKVLDISQLPVSIRSELPKITLNAHIYSNVPSSRIINVNGIIIKEGDEITNKLKVEEITVSGVIFNYKDYRFQMRAF